MANLNRRPRPFVCAAFVLALLPVARLARADDTPTYADRSDDEVRDTDRAWSFLLNPLATVIGFYGGEVDFVVTRFAAIAVEGDLYHRGGTTALAVGTGLVVYPLGNAFHKLYVEPRLVYARPLSAPITDFDWDADVVGVGATAGWQWTWDYGFCLRLGGGAMKYIGGQRRASSSVGPSLGSQPVLDGSLGWAF